MRPFLLVVRDPFQKYFLELVLSIGFGQEIIHACFQTCGAVFVERIGGHRDDGGAEIVPLSRANDSGRFVSI